MGPLALSREGCLRIALHAVCGPAIVLHMGNMRWNRVVWSQCELALVSQAGLVLVTRKLPWQLLVQACLRSNSLSQLTNARALNHMALLMVNMYIRCSVFGGKWAKASGPSWSQAMEDSIARSYYSVVGHVSPQDRGSTLGPPRVVTNLL